ncbi:EamA family transporter [Sulfuriflexus mobilis]|uniref:EamA family transporter n=1 Tax=Sulfuriflexus mobilis TaxID=1811807 RepID=UPI000F845504|nr:EamA family transporter [Sulfuriflexus mobilis]
MNIKPENKNMWIVYAFLSAFTAALVAIFAKLGLREVDPTLATTLRSIIMAAFLLVLAWGLGKFHNFTVIDLSGKEWGLLVLAGIAGALSWLFYFLALRDGMVSAVVAIDRLSIVFVIILASVFLSEMLTWRTFAGAVLMVCGAILISLKGDDFAQLWADLLRLIK